MGIELAGGVKHGEIHFSDRFPMVKTPCGLSRAPAAAQWRYVTCLICLRAAPKDPRIEARIRHVVEEERLRNNPP